MGLLSDNARLSGRAFFDGDPLFPLPVKKLNQIRGNTLSIIFQDAASALNPYRKIGPQMIEVLVQHLALPSRQAFQESFAMLTAVGLNDPEKIMRSYPHEISGGMQQRVLIAMALLCRPKLLIADEPTTALDVTTQAVILDLIKSLQKKFEMTVVFITHDLGVVSALAEEIMVLYAGQIVEILPASQLLTHPKHPYTQALLRSQPQLKVKESALSFIPGTLPDPFGAIRGCRFQSRCSFKRSECKSLNVENASTDINFCACPFSK